MYPGDHSCPGKPFQSTWLPPFHVQLIGSDSSIGIETVHQPTRMSKGPAPPRTVGRKLHTHLLTQIVHQCPCKWPDSANVFIPAWMVPPIYHSLRRESVKNTASNQAMGVKSVRPTWFEDPTVPKGPVTDSLPGPPEPMHGLRLMIREDASPLREQPSFPALKELAQKGNACPGNMELQTSTNQPQSLN